MTIRTITRRTVMLMAVSALCLGGTAAASASAATTSAGTSNARSAAATSDDGWIRLAHLSPNTPAVDVYLYSFGVSTAFQVLRHVSYGTVSAYEPLAAGVYSVAMRAAGAGPTTAAVLSTSVTIQAGHAYTVAGMGPESGLRLAVLDDTLTTPPGQALVRVIQASLQQHSVNVSFGGQVLQNGLLFGEVSSYQAVTPGSEAVVVTDASGGGDANASMSLAAGTVHTLVVLDGAHGLEVVDLVDASGDAADPVGGVSTGFGGTAPHGPPSPLLWLLATATGAALAMAAGLRLRTTRRQTLKRT
jgi:Domain of unknown function (DUF4397)